MNVVFFDVDTTGFTIADEAFRVALKLPDYPVNVFECWVHTNGDVEEYLGISRNYIDQLHNWSIMTDQLKQWIDGIHSKPALVCYSEFDYRFFKKLMDECMPNWHYKFQPYPIYITQLFTFMTFDRPLVSYKMDNILPAFGLERISPLCEFDVELTQKMFIELCQELKQ